MQISFTNMILPLLMIGLRISGLMVFAPFFAHAALSPRAKAALTVLFTAVLYPACIHQLKTTDISHLVPIMLGELLVGLAIGITTNLVSEAAQMAGQVLSIQMGYSLISILDPQTEVETTVLSVFHQTLAMLIFLRLDVHHWILRAIARSFQYVPLGDASITPRFTTAILHTGASILELGIQIAAPVLVATLLTDLVLGLLGKASPQMPLMLLGPALKGIIGVLVLAAALQYWPAMFEKYFSQSVAYSERILQLSIN